MSEELRAVRDALTALAEAVEQFNGKAFHGWGATVTFPEECKALVHQLQHNRGGIPTGWYPMPGAHYTYPVGGERAVGIAFAKPMYEVVTGAGR